MTVIDNKVLLMLEYKEPRTSMNSKSTDDTHASPAPMPDLYVIQEAPFVKYIALGEWLTDQLLPVADNWVPVSHLYSNYQTWVAAHRHWTTGVLDNPIGFSKKLKLVLGAKGWPCTSLRRQGVRGLLGLQLIDRIESRTR